VEGCRAEARGERTPCFRVKHRDRVHIPHRTPRPHAPPRSRSIFTSGTTRSASAPSDRRLRRKRAHARRHHRKMTLGANHDSEPPGVEVKVKEGEEEETLGQLRDRVVLAAARAAVPGPRAPFVHIKVEGSSSGQDTDGEGGEGEATGGEGDGEEEGREEQVEEDEEEKEEEEHEPLDLRAHDSGASLKGRSVAARPRRSPPGARSQPLSPRARRLAPGRFADNAVQNSGALQPEREREVVEEEAGFAPALIKRGANAPSGSSRFKGVSWDKARSKWKAQCKGKRLGLHTTEEAAAGAYSKYLEDGVVSPVPALSSQFTGVSWNKRRNTWQAKCKGTLLGHHATEEEAVRAYNKYLEDGIDPVKHREPSTSQFTGVFWDKSKNKWQANCKGKYLGRHITEEAAARAYNIEAERVGRPLNNVIPPVRAVGAGPGVGPGTGSGAGSDASPKRAVFQTPATPATSKKVKRAAPTTPAAPGPSKMTKLQDTSPGAAHASGVTTAQ